MSVFISIKIPNLDAAKAKFDAMPARVLYEIKSAIRTGAHLIEGNAKKQLGRGNRGWDTGRMASSIIPSFMPFKAEISPHTKYAIYVHQGTSPHWVPIAALAPWARRHGINPYAVQRSIAKKGTKANPFMDRAAVESQDGVFKIFLDAIANITNSV